MNNMDIMAMTREEKLEEARKLYKTANADQRYVLERLFHELIEDKDERIRKELISFFTERAKHTEDSTFNGLSSKEIIDWVEKQHIWSEEDKMQLDAAINLVSYTGHIETANWLKDLKTKIMS